MLGVSLVGHVRGCIASERGGFGIDQVNGGGNDDELDDGGLAFSLRDW